MGTTNRPEPHLVVFFLEIPDVVAVPHTTTFMFELPEVLDFLKGVGYSPDIQTPPRPNPDGRNFVSLKIWQVKVTAGADPAVTHVIDAVVPKENQGIAESPTSAPPDPRAYATIIEAVTALSAPSDGEISRALDNCLTALQDFLRAYGISSGNALPLITRERLPPLVLFSKRTLVTQQWDASMSAMFVNINVAREFLPTLDEAQLRKLALVLSRLKQEHPIIPYQEARLRAKRALVEDGNYQDAIVLSETAVEVLFDAVLTLVLWEEGVGAKVAAESIFSKQLPWRVEQALASRLGGDWKRSGMGPVSRWNSRLHYLRGRVIHASYRPTLQEAHECVDIATAIDIMVRDRIAGKAGTYPKTALLVLGQPGLERLKGWTRKMQEIAHKADLKAWTADYGKWRQTLDSERINLIR